MGNATLWKCLSAVVKIEAVRYIKSTGKEEKETRYYITSSKASVEVIGKAVRSHWGIENRLHRQLDVSFQEDQAAVSLACPLFIIQAAKRRFSG
jgi:predicted transposase YbfD/YdcC